MELFFIRQHGKENFLQFFSFYIKGRTTIENQIVVTDFLKKWIAMNNSLINLSANAPLVQPILPLSKSLSDLSEQLLLVLEKKQSVSAQFLNDLFAKCNSKNHADVELAICNSLKKLM